jgi:hypothetical protein
LKLPTEGGGKKQKKKKNNLKNSPKSFVQFDLCNTPKRNRKHHDTEEERLESAAETRQARTRGQANEGRGANERRRRDANREA